jgi:hypothetical protein
MKIAFASKGGRGKAILSPLFVRHLVRQGLPVALRMPRGWQQATASYPGVGASPGTRAAMGVLAS